MLAHIVYFMLYYRHKIFLDCGSPAFLIALMIKKWEIPEFLNGKRPVRCVQVFFCMDYLR